MHVAQKCWCDGRPTASNVPELMVAAIWMPSVFSVIRLSSTNAHASRSSSVWATRVLQLKHFYSALAHFEGEIVVVLPRLMDPDDIVIEQIPTIAGRQPLVGQRRRANQNCPQLPNLRMNSKLTHVALPERRCLNLSVSILVLTEG
jgi:hypothetical protein